MKRHKIGEPPANRIAVLDHKLRVRGHVGRTATSATVARFGVGHGADIGKVKGKTVWIGKAPPGHKAAAPASFAGKREPAPDRRNALGSAKPRR
jgi:hypothetical protein